MLYPFIVINMGVHKIICIARSHRLVSIAIIIGIIIIIVVVCVVASIIQKIHKICQNITMQQFGMSLLINNRSIRGSGRRGCVLWVKIFCFMSWFDAKHEISIWNF